jgi:hypothetical protein
VSHSRIAEDALPFVGKLATAGQETRAALDTSFIDMRDALRNAVAAGAGLRFGRANNRRLLRDCL